MLDTAELSQSTVLFVQGNQKLGEAYGYLEAEGHNSDLWWISPANLCQKMICVRRQDKRAFPYLAVTAPEMCSEEYPGLYHSCCGAENKCMSFKVKFCMDLDQEAPLNPADHITPQWKTMDFPLIASVGENFAYSCKSPHTFWSSCSADLLSQFHGVQFSRPQCQGQKSEVGRKAGRKITEHALKQTAVIFRYCKDLLYFCLKFNRSSNQICYSIVS